MKSIKKAKIAYIAYSLALMALGIAIIIFPSISVGTTIYALGGLLVVCGIVRFLNYFSKDSYGLAFQFDFALGIFTVLMGAIILFHPKGTIAFVNVLIGIFVIIDGTFKLQTAKDAKEFGLKNWWLILVCAIITAITGMILVFNPFEGAIAMAIALGIALISAGIENLCVAIYTVKLIKQMDKQENIFR